MTWSVKPRSSACEPPARWRMMASQLNSEAHIRLRPSTHSRAIEAPRVMLSARGVTLAARGVTLAHANVTPGAAGVTAGVTPPPYAAGGGGGGGPPCARAREKLEPVRDSRPVR